MWFSANQIPATFRSGVALPVIGRSAVTWSKSWVTLDLRYISKFPSKIDTKFPQPTYYYDNNRPPLYKITLCNFVVPTRSVR